MRVSSQMYTRKALLYVDLLIQLEKKYELKKEYSIAVRIYCNNF